MPIVFVIYKKIYFIHHAPKNWISLFSKHWICFSCIFSSNANFLLAEKHDGKKKKKMKIVERDVADL